MSQPKTSLVDEAVQAGVESFTATMGALPDRFRVLHKYAPGTFAGYGLLRSALMQDPPAGALDLRTKELMFTGLSTLYGDTFGATSHAISALKLGVSLAEIGEIMTQVIMVGGITAWNLVGYDVMLACEAHVAAMEKGAAPLPG